MNDRTSITESNEIDLFFSGKAVGELLAELALTGVFQSGQLSDPRAGQRHPRQRAGAWLRNCTDRPEISRKRNLPMGAWQIWLTSIGVRQPVCGDSGCLKGRRTR